MQRCTLIVRGAGGCSDESQVPCLVSPFGRLKQSIPAQLTVKGFWSSGAMPCLAALHMVSAAAGPALRALPCSPQMPKATIRTDRFCSVVASRFVEQHKMCLEGNKALMVQLPGAMVLLLAAAFTTAEHAGVAIRGPVFWGYVLPRGVLEVCGRLVINRRLAICLSLEAVLVHMLDEEGLKAAIARAEAKGWVCKQQAEAVASMQRDLASLRMFASMSVVQGPDGKVHKACQEEIGVGSSSQDRMRTVLRLLDGDNQVIFARLGSNHSSRSTIVRIRPGWRELKQQLSGMRQADGTPKVDVFAVGKTAHAHELVRLLDGASRLVMAQPHTIPDHGPGAYRKNLLRILMGSGARWTEADGVSPVSLAVAFDAAAGVSAWMREDRQQVIDIPAFHPHHQVESATQQVLVQQVAAKAGQLWTNVYEHMDKVLAPRARQLASQRYSEAFQAREPFFALPACRTVASLLPKRPESPPPTTSAAAGLLPGASISQATVLTLPAAAAVYGTGHIAASGPSATARGQQHQDLAPADVRRRAGAATTTAAAATAASGLGGGASLRGGAFGLNTSGRHMVLPGSGVSRVLSDQSSSGSIHVPGSRTAQRAAAPTSNATTADMAFQPGYRSMRAGVSSAAALPVLPSPYRGQLGGAGQNRPPASGLSSTRDVPGLLQPGQHLQLTSSPYSAPAAAAAAAAATTSGATTTQIALAARMFDASRTAQTKHPTNDAPHKRCSSIHMQQALGVAVPSAQVPAASCLPMQGMPSQLLLRSPMPNTCMALQQGVQSQAQQRQGEEEEFEPVVVDTVQQPYKHRASRKRKKTTTPPSPRDDVTHSPQVQELRLAAALTGEAVPAEAVTHEVVSRTSSWKKQRQQMQAAPAAEAAATTPATEPSGRVP